MEPQSQERAGFSLPSPLETNGAVSGQPAAPEMAPTPALNVASNTPNPQPQTPPILNVPAGAYVPQMPTNAVPSTTTSDVTSTADDADLIEKEWVERAKKIVEATRDDPYQQSQELTAVKADYMKKRYNKTIKPSE